jgi:hypothetical protein
LDELFEKYNFNVVQQSNCSIELNESDDTIYISLQKYDPELFSNLVKIDGYLWLSTTKTHLIPLKHKSMLLDILAEINRTYEWKSEI